jgi:hypothetical protein
MNDESSLLNFFDKTYIINLPERYDRRQEIMKELKRIGATLSDQVVIFPAIKPTDQGEFPSIGAKGCFLSHLAILTEARDQGLNSVLILEDDLSFKNLLIKQQERVVSKLQQLEWDFVYLGHGINKRSTENVIFEEFPHPLMLAHFIGINRRVIAPLASFLKTVSERPDGHPEGGAMHVDGAYSTFRKQNPNITLIANPSLGFQRSSPSDIATRQWFDNLPALSQLVAKLRKIKDYSKRIF